MAAPETALVKLVVLDEDGALPPIILLEVFMSL
jgi:hypothetical protein